MTTLKTITLAALCITLSGCYNWTGANHAKAEQEAKAYAAKARKAGADISFLDCTKHDTDGDGYLACDFIVDGQPVTLDCAGKDLVQDNHGCKVYVAKMRVTNVSTQH